MTKLWKCGIFDRVSILGWRQSYHCPVPVMLSIDSNKQVMDYSGNDTRLNRHMEGPGKLTIKYLSLYKTKVLQGRREFLL